MEPVTLEYDDRFLGRMVRSPHLLLRPDAFVRLLRALAAHLPLPRSHSPQHHHPAFDYTHISLLPAHLQRAACGLSLSTALRLAAAPPGCVAHAGTRQRLASYMLLRVVGGLTGRVQVIFSHPNSVCALRTCVVTRAAEDAGKLQGATPSPLVCPDP